MNNDNSLAKDQELIRLQMGRPATLDPVLLGETVGKEITDNVYEKLVFYEGKTFTEFAPMLSDSWEISSNGLEYTFSIRKGVLFHDGASLDAIAVCASLRRMAELSQHETVHQVLQPDNINAFDEYTVRITLTKRFPGFLHLMASQEASIISPKILIHKSDAEAQKWLEFNAAGTGPFFLDAFHEKEVILKKFENYWRKTASLRKVTIFFEDDIEKRKDLFLSNKADISIDEGNDVNQYITMPDVTIENNKSLDLVVLSYNLSKPYMQNLLFRKALAHSLDVKKYIQETRKGYGFEIKGIIPEGLLGFTNDLPTCEYDLELAQMYLRQSGINVDDIPVLKILLPLGNGENFYIQDYWKDNLSVLGLKVVVEFRPWQEFLGGLRKGSFDIYSLAWAPDYPDPDNYVFQFLHSQGRVAQYMRLGDCYGTFIDSLIEDARFEDNDISREKKYHAIQHICADYCLYVTLYQIYDIKVYKQWVKNIQYNPLYSDYYFYPINIERS